MEEGQCGAEDGGAGDGVGGVRVGGAYEVF